MKKVTVIAAADLASGIGHEGTIPWRCARDLKHFKETTQGKSLIMGRRTADSLPFKLPGRKTYVLSRNLDDHPHADKVCGSMLEATSLLSDEEEIFIAGGEEIYRWAFDQKIVTDVVLSTILGVWDCDKVFPMEYLKDFKARYSKGFMAGSPSFVVTWFK